jgi:hypothetical protein
MIYIAHRINTISKLLEVPKGYGVELDLRDYDGEIVIEHEPLKGGELFKNYIKQYDHKLIILNIKCEGVEDYVSEIIKEAGINDYFYLDISFPALIKLSKRKENSRAL